MDPTTTITLFWSDASYRRFGDYPPCNANGISIEVGVRIRIRMVEP